MAYGRDVIANALFGYREKQGTPRLWGKEHSEDRADAVLEALAKAGLEIDDTGARSCMVEALRIIAGEQQCLDNLMSNADVARAALAKITK